MKLLQAPLFLLLLSGLLAAVTFLGMQPPPEVPEIAPHTEFSAVRAHKILRTLNPESLSHPAGTPQNQLIRERLGEQLNNLGMEVELQSLNHCRPAFGTCSPLVNVVGRLPGSGLKPALMLTAHYDSVEVGTGAGDDGAGVAALLEIAAMAAQQANFKHDLIFVVTDAEEQGLIGADAFASRHPWFADVGVVINLEGRGASGASNMFETGAGNRSYIRMLAQALDRPVANSVSREVYRRMPNDTDFSVYRELGRSGFNFAFTDGAAVYHSALDDLQQLDIRSLQHHGQNAWALLQVLDQRDLLRVRTVEDAAYIDLFGQKLVHYPVSSATGLALVLAVLILVFIRLAFPRQLSFRQSAWSVWLMLLLLPLLAALGWILSWPLGHWSDLNRMGHPEPWLGRGALFLSAALALRIIFNGLSQRATTGSVTLVSWMFFAALAMLLSVKLPAASFIGILPMVAFMLGALLDGLFWKRHTQLLFARLFGFVAAAYLGFYFAYNLEVVLSFELAHLMILPLFLPTVAVLPLLPGNESKPAAARWSIVLLLLPILAAAIGQQFIPGHTVDRPRGMNLVYRAVEGQSETWWHLETSSSDPDRNFVKNYGYSEKTLSIPGRSEFPIMAKSAEPLELPAIQLLSSSQQRNEQHVVRSLQLDIPEGVLQLVFYLPDGLDYTQVLVNGVVALQKDLSQQQRVVRRAVAINRPAAGQMGLEILSPKAQSANAEVLGLPARARFGLPEDVLQDALQGWPLDAQPQQYGHRAEVHFVLDFKQQ